MRHYLEALETSKPKRGRKRTPASIDKRLAAIEDQLANADALTKLHLLQEQKDLTDERLRVAKVKDLTALEKQFIKVAQAYGERKGISYGTWRAAGVSANVLQAAGISARPQLDRDQLRLRHARTAAALEQRAQQDQPVFGAQQRMRGPLGVRHQPDHVAGLVGDAGDVVDRAVGVVQVAQHDPVAVVELRAGCRRRRCSCPRSG